MCFADAGSLIGDAVVAVRGLVFTVTSGVQPVIGGNFNSTQTFAITADVVDTNFDSGFLGDGDSASSDPIAGEMAANAATNGSYSVVGNTATLIMPVAVTIVDPDFTLSFNGTLRGSGPIFGDMDGNLSVNLADASLLVEALVDRAAYDGHGFGVNADLKGDVDQSGTFDVGDLAAFSALLGGPAAAVPEPDSTTLLGIALVLAVLCGYGTRIPSAVQNGTEARSLQGLPPLRAIVK